MKATVGKISALLFNRRAVRDRWRRLWLREGKSVWYALAGAVLLVLYGLVPTLQPANFGRVYAAYGGVFIVLSLLWGWRVDRIVPDRFDLIGGLVALAGVLIIIVLA